MTAAEKIISRGIYLITEHERLEFTEMLQITEAVMPLGISALQYRNKHGLPAQKLSQARQLQQLCCAYNVPFIINDDITLAIELDTDGVHLGQTDGTVMAARKRVGLHKLIGVSCYDDIRRADKAVQDGADYLAFGSMFPTSSKQDATRASCDLILQAKQRYTVPIAAIGGITPENCGPVIAAGADLLAVISSVYLATSPYQVIVDFRKLLATH